MLPLVMKSEKPNKILDFQLELLTSCKENSRVFAVNLMPPERSYLRLKLLGRVSRMKLMEN